jgi:hypothetical protein
MILRVPCLARVADEYPWWRPGGRSPFSFDPDKPLWPQVLSAVGQATIIFGGPVIGLIGISHFPALVTDAAIYGLGLGSIFILFLASFPLIPARSLPKGIPLGAALMFRAGWSLCMTFLWVGAGLMLNGYDTLPITRDVAVVGKRESLQRDPTHRQYSLEVRAWPPSRFVTEVDTTRQVFEAASVPVVAVDTSEATLQTMTDAGTARLTVGRGRLGLDWVKKIEVR